MKKRVVSALLCSIMLASLGMTGCGKSASDTKGEVKSVADDKEDENGKVNGVFYKEGLPIVDEGTFSFTIFCDDSTSTGEFYMLEQFEKETGVDVELEYYSYEVANEKLALALSSGDYPDMIGGWTLKASDILQYGVNQKVFVPLEDYIEEYCPNIQAVLEIPGVRETMTAPDGHIYAIPYVLDAPLVDFQISVNTKWLENLGLEMPTTTDEFYEVLKAFKEQDANGNGDPNDEIPLTFDPDNMHINYMMGWFGLSMDEYGMAMDDGELVFGANTETFKEGIKYLNKLYSEGLIDSEAFTQDSSQWAAKGAKDQFGASMMYASGDFKPYNAGEVPDWAPLPVLSSPQCDDPVWFQDSTGVSVLKNQLVVTDNASDIGAILRFWDYVYDAENSIEAVCGPMGDILSKEGDQYHKVDMTTRSEEEQEKYSWANLFPQSLPKNMPLGFQLYEDPMPYSEKDVVDEEYADNLSGVLPSYWLPLDQADRMAEIQNAIQDYIEQKSAEWIAGQADIDKEWDSYCEYLNTLGLEDYLKMRQETAAQTESAAE